MRNHTLMQTIARANRVWGEKVNGLIVDYIGVFRDLQKALAIYGTASGGEVKSGDIPVETKKALVNQLKETIQETRNFLSQHGISLDDIIKAAADISSFKGVAALDDAVDALLVNDDTKREYLTLSRDVDRIFKAILPDKSANKFGVDRKAIVVIADKIRSLTPPADISEVMGDVEDLLDESIAPTGYIIRGAKKPIADSAYLDDTIKDGHYVDLSKIDFDALKKAFEKRRKHIEAEKLRGAINSKLRKMVRLNKSRMDYYQKFQQLIDEYNAGAKNVDVFFAELITLAQALNEEEKRGIAEQLTEEELALFDILTKPDVRLTRKEQKQVKAVARELLDTLKAERLVLDWRKHQQTRAQVQLQIETTLDKLPDIYDKDLYDRKCQLVYQHVYDSYYGDKKSVYYMGN
jgi:type I restriction enzyme R subunit